MNPPLLANLFMHYAFDAWMARTYPGVTFERYCDDVVVHGRSKAQAEAVREAIGVRMEEVGPQLHPDKTRVVYCKDSNRMGAAVFEKFAVLGYEFRPRLAKGAKDGVFFVSFSQQSVGMPRPGSVTRSGPGVSTGAVT